MLRRRKNAIKAKEYAETGDGRPCAFCERKHTGAVIETSAHMLVLENILPYDVFEGGVVEQHYMLIPKKHRESLAQFTDSERLDYLRLLAKYEQVGYNSYTRSVTGKTRSVAHYHTHLLYTPSGRVRAFLFWSKPYILLFKKPKTKKKA